MDSYSSNKIHIELKQLQIAFKVERNQAKKKKLAMEVKKVQAEVERIKT